MKAVTAILVFCLSTAFGNHCSPSIVPWYDCTYDNHNGRFFVHPNDCTYIVACINSNPVVASLCETIEDETGNPRLFEHTLGCPWTCAERHKQCQESSSSTTEVATPPTVKPHCPPRPKPSYDCSRDSNNGEFSPHPDDCTFLVACINSKAIIASLCKEPSNSRSIAPRLDHVEGCPWKCDELIETCPWAPTTQPTCSQIEAPKYDCSQHDAGDSELFPHPDDCTFLVACIDNRAIVAHLCGGIDKPMPKVSYEHALGCPWMCDELNTGCYTHATAAAMESPKTCHEKGLFPVPEDCTLAYGCAAVGMPAIVISVCEAKDNDFDVPGGCPDLCPGATSAEDESPNMGDRFIRKRNSSVKKKPFYSKLAWIL